MNLYAYAGNNPVAFNDPFGLCPDPDDPTCPRLGEEHGRFKALVGRVVDFFTGGTTSVADARLSRAPGSTSTSVGEKLLSVDPGRIDYSVTVWGGPIGASVGTGGVNVTGIGGLTFGVTVDATYTAPGRDASGTLLGGMVNAGPYLVGGAVGVEPLRPSEGVNSVSVSFGVGASATVPKMLVGSPLVARLLGGTGYRGEPN